MYGDGGRSDFEFVFCKCVRQYVHVRQCRKIRSNRNTKTREQRARQAQSENEHNVRKAVQLVHVVVVGDSVVECPLGVRGHHEAELRVGVGDDDPVRFFATLQNVVL
jgi:hypothetical protein